MVVGTLTAIGVAVVVAMIWLWPSHQHVDIPLPMQNGGGGAVQTEAGTVTMQDLGPCGSASNGRAFTDTPEPPPTNAYTCQRSLVSIDSGPSKGSHTLLEIAPGPGQPDLHAGDHIRLVRQDDPSGNTVYSFDDYSRGLPLLLIALIFVVVIVAVARWRGLRAVIGLVFAFGILVVFMLPALLDGKPALPVALVAGALILYAVLYLAHGVNLRTSSALLGTLSAMVLAAVLSWVALEVTHLTGLSEEQNTNVATYIDHVSITGLLLAGFIIGSLGVLNDVTITQASAAFELAAIDEEATRREVFGAAMRVGRDHIASTVYTLVLAYAGGALPLLLMFSVAGRSIRDVLTGDAVAIEITRSAVGGICLALSVPLTTAIAVLLARPFGRAALADADEPEPRRVRTAGRRGDNNADGGADSTARRRAPGSRGPSGDGRRRLPDRDAQPTGGHRRIEDTESTGGQRRIDGPPDHTGGHRRIAGPGPEATGARRRDRRPVDDTGAQRITDRSEPTGSNRRLPQRPPRSGEHPDRQTGTSWPTTRTPQPGRPPRPDDQPRTRPSWPTTDYRE
ncbi:putative membrane protein [Nocardia nova SH22a]|uniref:Putative membrane protein n=1 Tax=Nocardia nova SH22a TaxID=1415166 RepID=W5TSB8_9NOCA|nr:putative membrane protein [Nocardia nova SH22a]